MVLGRFLDAEYADLGAQERDTFESLLSEQDPDLAAWLWGGESPPPKWKPLIERIQRSAGIAP